MLCPVYLNFEQLVCSWWLEHFQYHGFSLIGPTRMGSDGSLLSLAVAFEMQVYLLLIFVLVYEYW